MGRSRLGRVFESGPEPRGMAGMAYDSKSSRVLLHGGRDKDRKALGDLWAWDGSEWREIGAGSDDSGR